MNPWVPGTTPPSSRLDGLSDSLRFAKAIEKTATVKRPRIRYAVGGGAKPILFLRRMLPDRTYDRLSDMIVGVKPSAPRRTGSETVSR